MAQRNSALPVLASGAREGVVVGITFCLAFLGVGAVYRTQSLGALPAAASTLLLMSGPAQVALADGLRAHQSLAAMLLAVCVINGRYAVMSAALAPSFARVPLSRLLLPWTFLSTTTFAGTHAALRRPEPAAHPLAFFLGLCAVSIPAAVLGTLLGYCISDLLPPKMQVVVDMILPTYFVILLARQWPHAHPLLAGGLGFLLTPALEALAPGWGLLLACLVVGAAVGLMRPKTEEGNPGDA
jgi:predicted branched-subunit amino acid permease